MAKPHSLALCDTTMNLQLQAQHDSLASNDGFARVLALRQNKKSEHFFNKRTLDILRTDTIAVATCRPEENIRNQDKCK